MRGHSDVLAGVQSGNKCHQQWLAWFYKLYKGCTHWLIGPCDFTNKPSRFIINLKKEKKSLQGCEKWIQRMNELTDLVSPVSFLKEKPSSAIFLPVTVLKRQSIILQANRRLWYSFMSITWEIRNNCLHSCSVNWWEKWCAMQFPPVASRRPPQAGWGPRRGKPDSAHPSGNSFHQNLPRVSQRSLFICA